MLLYLRTAKTASSTVNAWCGADIKTTFNKRFLWEAPNQPEIETALAKKWYLFTTVRNPFTRAISCWRQANKAAWIRNEVTFKDFLNLDFNSFESSWAITHTIPVAEYLEPYMDKIDNFIKIENITEELRKIEKKFNLKQREVKKYNESRYMDDKSLKDVYDDEAIQMVLDKYSIDFETFNYSKSIVDI